MPNYQKTRLFFVFIFVTATIPLFKFFLPVQSDTVLGFNLTGWAWIIMLVISIIFLLGSPTTNFPLLIWIPWVLFIIIRLVPDFSFLGLQLTGQYLLPIIIGLVCASLHYNDIILRWIFKSLIFYCSLIFFIYLLGIIFRNGYFPLVSITPMIYSICAVICLGCFFVMKRKKFFFYYLTLLIIPFTTVARMGLVAILMILGIHIGNRSITFRLFSLIIVSILGLYVFYSPRFQEKSFSSGHGDLSDISLNYYENETFKTSGRMTWRLALESGLEEAPLFGNGPRSENIAFTYIGAPHSEAHNDFLSVRYNYGWIGLYTLLFGFFIQFISLFRRKKQYQTTYSFILWSGTLTLFPVFLLFMYSDNILKYTIFFPNYFFAMIGILYSNSLNQDVSKPLLKR